MQLYKFMASRGEKVGLSADQTGENLPKEFGPWSLIKSLDVVAEDDPRIGASSEEIIAGIEKEGFFLWPVSEGIS